MMEIEQLILLAINIVGGIAVISSYVLCLKSQEGGADALWGGVPQKIRPAYGISMIIAALGYFAFLSYIFFQLEPATVTIAGTFSYNIFYAVFVLILLPSALWMPLTSKYVDRPAALKWVGVRLVLFIVGLASIGLVWTLLSLDGIQRDFYLWLAVAGSGYFAFHTMVLDAIIWAALFKK